MTQIPVFDLYGEHSAFPDLLHCEAIIDRAAQHDWRIEMHRHADLHQFFLLVAGQAEMAVEGEERALELPVLVSVPRHAVHGFRFAQGTEGFVLTLPVAEFPDLAAGPVAARLQAWAALPADGALRDLVGAISAEHRGRGFARDVLLRALAVQLVALVARRLSEEGAEAHHPYARRMQALDALIQQNLRHRWTVADYAAALGMTPTHLSRVTKAATGLPASRYVERLLFQEARRLLAYTRASIADVGFVLGFEDAAYFSRAFRRQCGLAPHLYRRQVWEGQVRTLRNSPCTTRSASR